MNSKAVKILLEVLGAVVVSAILSFIPQEALPFVVDLAIIPLIFVALRRGLVFSVDGGGSALRVCVGVRWGGVVRCRRFVSSCKWSRILYGSFPRFSDGIRIRGRCRILCT